VALYHRIAWALSAQGELNHRKAGRSIFSTLLSRYAPCGITSTRESSKPRGAAGPEHCIVHSIMAAGTRDADHRPAANASSHSRFIGHLSSLIPHTEFFCLASIANSSLFPAKNGTLQNQSFLIIAHLHRI